MIQNALDREMCELPLQALSPLRIDKGTAAVCILGFGVAALVALTFQLYQNHKPSTPSTVLAGIQTRPTFYNVPPQVSKT